MDEAIRALVGEATVNQGRVKLELPTIVENGNSVSLTVSVDSPMTVADHVASIVSGEERKILQFPAETG